MSNPKHRKPIKDESHAPIPNLSPVENTVIKVTVERTTEAIKQWHDAINELRNTIWKDSDSGNGTGNSKKEKAKKERKLRKVINRLRKAKNAKS